MKVELPAFSLPLPHRKRKTLNLITVSMKKSILLSVSPQDLPLYLHTQISQIFRKKKNLLDFHPSSNYFPLSLILTAKFLSKCFILCLFYFSSLYSPFNLSLNIVSFAVQIALLLSICWDYPSFRSFISFTECSLSLALLSPASSSLHLSSLCHRMIFPVQMDHGSLHRKESSVDSS